jgi:hypothetical protein
MARRAALTRYSSECLEGAFYEVSLLSVLRSPHSPGPLRGNTGPFMADLEPSEVRCRRTSASNQYPSLHNSA